MAICSRCGFNNSDSARFCSNCTTPLFVISSFQVPPSPPPRLYRSGYQSQSGRPTVRKRSRIGVASIIVILVVVIVLAAGGLDFLETQFKNWGGQTPPDSQPTSNPFVGTWNGTYHLEVHTTYWDGSSWKWYMYTESGFMTMDFSNDYVVANGRQIRDTFTGALLETVIVEGNININIGNRSESRIDGTLEFTTITSGISAYPSQTFVATVSSDSIQGSLEFESFELYGSGTFSLTRL